MQTASLARAELLERLQYFKLAPRVVIDLGCGTGENAAALRHQFPRARVIAVDRDPAMTQQARQGQRFWRRFDCICADAHALPFAAQSADLVFSNLLLPQCKEPLHLFAEVQRTLRSTGLLLFATLGPGTAPQRPDTPQLPDMPQLGAALGAAGLAEPVMDREMVSGCELIYGAAFAGQRAAAAAAHGVHDAGEALVPVSSLRRRPRP